MKNYLPDIKKLLLMIGVLISISSPLALSEGNTELLWRDVNEFSIALKGTRYIIPQKFRTLELDIIGLEKALANAPMEFTAEARMKKLTVSLPMPDGKFNRFEVVNSPIMAPELAAKYPEIQTYLGQGIDDKTAIVRFDITPKGFHAMILSVNGSVFIDPYSTNDIAHYVSYFRRDYFANALGKGEFACHTEHDPQVEREIAELVKRLPKNSGTQLRTYRLALAATGEYTVFQGGTVPLALAAMVTTMNRVNGIYEREVAIRMVLIANDSVIIYTNGSTDPYTNGNTTTMLGQNQSNLNSVIGSSNYDIGHVFGTNSGGQAGLGVVCNNDNKARGVTGSASPVGDPFDVDYVAHEMGHQFSADHTFNSNTGSCAGSQWSADYAYEPGSGTTIMAYAGICVGQNVQMNSDPYFHLASLLQIVAYSSVGNGNSCPTVTATGNTPPEASALSRGYTIPINTPFYLTGAGGDNNGDAITYCWEEYDKGPTGPPSSPSGNAPIFRSFLPTTNPVRTFPKLNDILTNTPVMGELLPSYARTMNFRLTTRDNRAGGGGFAWDSTYIFVNASAGPFQITYPSNAVTWTGGSSRSITWDVANTNVAPVSCSFVKILLSTDGGNTFPIELASATLNDGEHTVTVPNLNTTQARIRIEAVGNVFFDINNSNFSIEYNNPVPSIISTAPASVTAGSAGFSMTVFGSDFVSSSVVYWNGSARTTTYIGETELDFYVNDYDIASAGYSTVRVFNPTPGGGTSNGLTITINNPAPAISSLSPSNAQAGSFNFTLIVNGSNFVNGSVVTWNGANRTTTYVSPTRVDASIMASDIASAGTATVRVYNPTPGGGTSSGSSFTIYNPLPGAVSLTPSSVIVGGDAFTLTVYGVDFVPTSVVRLNGVDKTTSYVSGTQLNALITAEDRAAASENAVTVFNPTPGGGVSNGLSFMVNNPEPSLVSISPSSAIAGGDGFTMTVNGLYFLASSVVKINGSARTTTYISSTQLEAAITAGDRAAAGTSTITVFNPSPGGGTSSGQTFTVNNPTPYISSISPTSVIAGGDWFTLTVTGSNFMTSSLVRINGSERATTFINSTELQAVITANDRATGVAASITVNSPGPGGGTSNTRTLNVNNPVPYISSINPSTVIAGGSEFTMTLTGQYFVPGSIVRVNGADRTTNYVSSTEIEAVITAADRANGGTDTITVFNPSPAGGLSNEKILSVNNPQPYISSISPANVTAGGPAFTLTINGTYFVTGSVVRWNGSDRPTTFVSGSQLTASISAEDIVLSGIANVTVFNSTPGGGTSLEWAVTISYGPSQQASNIVLTGVTENQATINWTDGNGSNRAVFMKRGAEGTAIPANDSTYTANTIYGIGAQIGSSGWFCVFNGTTHSGGVTVTGLEPGRYRIMICEYNGNPGEETYNINSGTNNPLNLLAVNTLAFPGNAIDVDGEDDYVKCSNSESVKITGTAITLEAWVKAWSWQNNVWEGSIISKEGTAAGYMLRCGDNGKVNFCFGDGDSWHEVTTASVLSTDCWRHLAAVYNGALMKIYIDGEEAASQAHTEAIADNSNYLWIASSAANPGRMFNGKIDEVRIWNTARSQSEIQAGMLSALNGSETGLAAYYKFDQGTPAGNNEGNDALLDFSQNYNDGVLNNFALSGTSSNWILSGAGPHITVNLKMYIEGLYSSALSGHVCQDTITARLKSVDGNFTTQDSIKAVLLTDGTSVLRFGNAPAGTYYLVINHRSSIETWSKTGGEALVKGSASNYDFTTAASQAFGSNLILCGGHWCVYSGDVNQDGKIDYYDIKSIDVDMLSYATGYLPTDLNGDSVVDFSDMIICDNNYNAQVHTLSPLLINKNAGPSAKKPNGQKSNK